MTLLAMCVLAALAGVGAGAAYGTYAWRNKRRTRRSSAWAIAGGVVAVPLMALDNRIFFPLASFVLPAMLAMIVVIRTHARNDPAGLRS